MDKTKNTRLLSQTRFQNLVWLMNKHKELRKQKDLGARTGVAAPYISQVLGAKRNLGHEVVKRIEAALGLPDGWMDVPRGAQAKVLKAAVEVIPVRRVPLVEWSDIAKAGVRQATRKKQSTSKALPPVYVRREDAQMVYTGATVGMNGYAVQLDGDAMWDSRSCTGVPEGAFLVVDPDIINPVHGDVVVIAYEDAEGRARATCRQMISDGGRQYFKPANPRYPVESELRGLRVCGVAIRWELGRDLRPKLPAKPRARKQKSGASR